MRIIVLLEDLDSVRAILTHLEPSAGELLGICGFREDLRPSDPSTVREIVASAGFLCDHEIEFAVQLVYESLSTDQPDEYHFLFAEVDDQTTGYSARGLGQALSCRSRA